MELRNITGFPDYKVSSEGRVWSEKTQRWLKGRLNKDGYLRVNLCVDGKHYTKTIHRLVAEAFLLNPNNMPEVNHKDECKTNNAVTNLEWVTAKYNISYGTRTERAVSKVKTTQQERRGKPVVQLTLDGKEVARFCCANEAARQTGFDHGGISQVCRGERKTYGSYRWQYIEAR